MPDLASGRHLQPDRVDTAVIERARAVILAWHPKASSWSTGPSASTCLSAVDAFDELASGIQHLKLRSVSVRRSVSLRTCAHGKYAG